LGRYISMVTFVTSAVDNIELDLNLYLNNELVTFQVVQTESEKMQTITADKIIKFDMPQH
jgi:hypothetical protein